MPTSAASGIAVIANRNAFHVKCVSGQRNVGAPWVIGHTVTVAMHDVATATSTASGRQLRSTMPNGEQHAGRRHVVDRRQARACRAAEQNLAVRGRN